MPYLPLYVQDFLTDEKLIECSAESTGVYIRLLCIMHKAQEYGTILLKQKDKQNGSTLFNFASKLSKQMPWDTATILRGLEELVSEGVVTVEGDKLYQKRMVKDGKVSDARASAGKKGGQKSRQKIEEAASSSSFASGFASDFAQAKIQANTENENDNDNNTPLWVVEERREGGCRGDGKEEDPALLHDTFRNPDLARVMNHYFDTVDPTPSTLSMQELAEYTKQFGSDIVLHAIDRARDLLKARANWAYIRGILRGYAKTNVQTLGDVISQEQEFEEAADRKSGHSHAGRPASASAGAMDDLRQLHEMFDRREGQ